MRRAAAIPAAPAPTIAMSTCDVGSASTGLAMAAADAARNERRFRIGMVTGVLGAARAASTNLSVRANRSPARRSQHAARRPAFRPRLRGPAPCKRPRGCLRLAPTREAQLLAAAIKAITQMFSRPCRTVLLKAVGLAIALLAVLAIVLYRLLSWLTGAGGTWVEGAIGPMAHGPVTFLGWLLAFALGIGLVAGAIFLMPAVTSLVASFFADEIAEHVERTEYPLDPVGTPLPAGRAVLEGLRTAGLAVLIYLVCAPFLLFAGFGAVRFHPVGEAKALRRRHRTTIFIAGMFIAGFVSIPILNLATPLFGTAFMVHMHKRLTRSGRTQELLEPVRPSS